MKNIITLLLLTAITTSSIYSQKNAVKLHLESLFYGAANVAYERNIGDKITAGINVGVFIPREIPFYSPVEDTASNYANTDEIKNTFSGLMITPEFRFYPKGNGKGFYVGGYLKYSNYKLGTSQTNTYALSNSEYNDLDPQADYYGDVNHSTREIDIKSDIDYKLKQFGGGLQLGVQWIIADRFVIDWGFIGFGYNVFKASGELTILQKDIPIEYSRYAGEVENNINQELAELPGSPKASVVGKDKSIKATIPFASPGIRSFLSIGMKF